MDVSIFKINCENQSSTAPVEEFERPWIAVATMNFAGAVFCVFVMLSMVIFAEKRQQVISKLNFAFAFSTMCAAIAFTLSVILTTDDIKNNIPICTFQGAVNVYFLFTLIFLWLFITRHLYQITCTEEGPMLSYINWYLTTSYVAPLLILLFPIIYDDFDYNGYFCFVSDVCDGDWTQVFAYGLALIVGLYGLSLWVLVFIKLVALKAKTGTLTMNVSVNTKKGVEQPLLSSKTIVDRFEVSHVIVRQFVFASTMLIFLIIFAIIFVLNYINHNRYRDVTVLCIGTCISLLSLIVLFVWGATRPNLRLWHELLFGIAKTSPDEQS